MDSKSTLSKQDFMLEKLARWKVEKARKKQYADNGKMSQCGTKSMTRRPLKEPRAVNHIRTARAEKTSSNKRSSLQTTSSKSSTGRMKSKKDERRQSNLTEKSPVKEITMREKLELWKAQKQEKNKKTPSQTSHSSMKKEGSTRHLAHVTPSAKTPLPPWTPSCKGLTDAEETRVGDTPKKHLFKTPTSVKGKPLQSAISSRHQSTAGISEEGGSKNHSLATKPHPTDINENRLHITRSSPTLDEPPRKRKAVTFLSTATPVRCSPRLQKNKESTGLVGRGQPDAPATPKQPWQDKKLDMQQRLEQWLASKSKTPSRYSNLLNFKKTPADRIRRSVMTPRHAKPTKVPPPVWHLDSEPSSSLDSSTSQEEDELRSALNCTMDECFLLLQSGCPTEHVSEWLDNLVDRVPAMCQCAKYWLCRVSIAQEEGLNANEIIHIYEEAVRECAQPIQEVKDSLQQYVTTLIHKQPSAEEAPITSPDAHTVTDPAPETPTPRGSRYPAAMDQLLQSSVLRYCLTESTPYFDRIRAAIGHQPPAPTTPGLKLVTPVRRSTRLEGRRSILPFNLQDHDVCLASLGDLPLTGPQEFILRTNRALEGEFLEETDERLDVG
ncbi:cytoskeleton-associated protein 2-like [Patiria miniata]|uniref:Cytoskeleton-associated protein 2 C-terminal domain-containing protein n=1 Tax=Patiria miniata TaxID=46514 RepID=A0A913ZYU4_PATMI|nr:cytoskeleton-associated protein 2-like [Patiria miniata]